MRLSTDVRPQLDRDQASHTCVRTADLFQAVDKAPNRSQMHTCAPAVFFHSVQPVRLKHVPPSSFTPLTTVMHLHIHSQRRDFQHSSANDYWRAATGPSPDRVQS